MSSYFPNLRAQSTSKHACTAGDKAATLILVHLENRFPDLTVTIADFALQRQVSTTPQALVAAKHHRNWRRRLGLADTNYFAAPLSQADLGMRWRRRWFKLSDFMDWGGHLDHDSRRKPQNALLEGLLRWGSLGGFRQDVSTEDAESLTRCQRTRSGNQPDVRDIQQVRERRRLPTYLHYHWNPWNLGGTGSSAAR